MTNERTQAPPRRAMEYAIRLLEAHLEAKRFELAKYAHNQDIAQAVNFDIEDLTRAVAIIKE